MMVASDDFKVNGVSWVLNVYLTRDYSTDNDPLSYYEFLWFSTHSCLTEMSVFNELITESEFVKYIEQGKENIRKGLSPIHNNNLRKRTLNDHNDTGS